MMISAIACVMFGILMRLMIASYHEEKREVERANRAAYREALQAWREAEEDRQRRIAASERVFSENA